jgi:hypothetical protein
MRASSRFRDRDEKNNIVFVEDMANQTGGMTITNDAEAVVDYYRTIYGNRVRIVYLDTDGEWWEIVWQIRNSGGNYVAFKPWNGLAWDILSRKE